MTAAANSDKNPGSGYSSLMVPLALLVCSFSGAILDRRLINHDSFGYLRCADALFFHGIYPTDNNYFAFPLLINLAFRMVGHTLTALHLFPFLAAVFSPLLLYGIAKKLCRYRLSAFLCGLVFVVLPAMRLYMNRATTESLFVFSALVFFLLVLAMEQRPWLVVFALPCASWLFLVRYDSLILIGIWTLTAAVRWGLSSGKDNRPPFLAVILGLFLALIIQIPFGVLNYERNLSGPSISTRLPVKAKKTSPAKIQPPFQLQRFLPAKKLKAWASISASRNPVSFKNISGTGRMISKFWNKFRCIPGSLPLYLTVGLLFGFFVLTGIWRAFRGPPRRGTAAAALIMTLYVILYSMLALFYVKGSFLRHFSRISPFVCLLGTLGAETLWNGSRGLRFGFRHLVPAAVLIIFAGFFSFDLWERKNHSDYRGSFLQILRKPLILPVMIETNHPRAKRFIPQVPLVSKAERFSIENRYNVEQIASFYGLRELLDDEDRRIRAWADYFYLDDFTDPKYLENCVFQGPADVDLWREEIPGFLGVLAGMPPTWMILRFQFDREISEVVISDYHITYHPKPRFDRLRFSTSSDGGESWQTWYTKSAPKNIEKFIQRFPEEFKGKKEIFLWYNFRSYPKPHLQSFSALCRRFYIAVKFKEPSS